MYCHCIYNCVKNIDLLCWFYIKSNSFLSFHHPPHPPPPSRNRNEQGEEGVKSWKFWANVLFEWPLKNVIQRGVGQLSTTNRSWVIEFFLELIVLFFGQNKYTNIGWFWIIFRHKIRVFNLRKVQKHAVFSTMGIQHIFNKS